MYTFLIFLLKYIEKIKNKLIKIMCKINCQAKKYYFLFVEKCLNVAKLCLAELSQDRCGLLFL